MSSTRGSSVQVQVIGRTRTGKACDWAVVDDLGLPVPVATRFLTHLANVERSVYTRRAYAQGLAYYLEFLTATGLDLDDVSNEVLARFARFLRAPSPDVLVISDASAARARTTVNVALAAVSSFYVFLGSSGRGTDGYRGWKRLDATAAVARTPEVTVVDTVDAAAHHRNTKRLGPRLPTTRPRLTTLSVQQAHEILQACRTYQERLIFMLAFTTGMRIGQILGLRHSDIDTRQRVITITPREDNENLARAKTRRQHQIPISKEAVRLYVTYMHEEYGQVDSDYVFISMSDARLGDALSVDTVYGYVRRLRRVTGIEGWTPHTLRHTFVTLQREAGVPIDVISHLVTHASITTTVDIYSHLSVEELRATLVRHGAWDVASV